mmetsp:Transcript_10232/g.23027  ORF Transcript_10232/g.23027 Transcript_10232/m.23027 type:complete len:243 (+) Transcript_10232:917-1645(+)
MQRAPMPLGRPSAPTIGEKASTPVSTSTCLPSQFTPSSLSPVGSSSQISTLEVPCQPASSVLTTTMLYGAVGHHMARQGAVWCLNIASRSKRGIPLTGLPLDPGGKLLVPAAPDGSSSQRVRKTIVRRSREQLASLVPHGENTTKRTSSVWSLSWHRSRDGAFRVLFRSSSFQDGNRSRGPERAMSPGSWQEVRRGQSQDGGAKKINLLLPARDGFRRIAGVRIRLSCSQTSLPGASPSSLS